MRIGVYAVHYCVIAVVALAGCISFRTSSHSFGNGECVEVGDHLELPKRIVIRDSQDPDGFRLSVSSAAWRTFTAQLNGL
jgi:Domain of unknown function (DUF397)